MSELTHAVDRYLSDGAPLGKALGRVSRSPERFLVVAESKESQQLRREDAGLHCAGEMSELSLVRRPKVCHSWMAASFFSFRLGRWPFIGCRPNPVCRWQPPPQDTAV
jgi:hypothetical protein